MAEENKSKKKIQSLSRTMPANAEAERALLSAIFLDNDICHEVIYGIKEEDFYVPAHKKIFSAILDVYNSGRPIDIVTVTDRLDAEGVLSEAGGLVYINGLLEALPSAAAYTHYLDIVDKNSLRRKIIRASGEIIENTYVTDNAPTALAYAEEKVFAIGKERETSDLTHIRESAIEVIQKFEGITTNPEKYRGLYTGFDRLDNITKGFLPGQLIVLAARPGCGKTSYVMNIVGHIARCSPEKKIAVFSLEMSESELTQRLICSLAQVPMSTFLDGKGKASDFEQVWEIKKMLDASNVFIDDSAEITPAEVMSKCRRLKQQKKGLDLIVIDYLQLLAGDRQRDSKQFEVAEMSRSMKILAKEIGVPVILLSQMNRSFERREGDKKPMLSDLRDSGAIEQDADIVLFLNPVDSKADENARSKFVQLIIAKHRSGPTGELYYKFYGELVRFMEVALKSGDTNKPAHNDSSETKTESVPFEIDDTVDGLEPPTEENNIE